MPQVNCPSCRKEYNVKDETLGKSAKCKCGKTFVLEEQGELKLADEKHAPATAAAAPVAAPAADTHVEPGQTDLFPETPQYRECIHNKCQKATVVKGELLRLVASPPFHSKMAGVICAHCKLGDAFLRFTWKDTGENLSAYRWRLLFRNPISGGTSWLVRVLLIALIPVAGTTLGVVLAAHSVASERAAAWKIGLALGVCVAGAIIWGIHRMSPPDYRRYR